MLSQDFPPCFPNSWQPLTCIHIQSKHDLFSAVIRLNWVSFNQHFRTNLSGLTFVYDASAWADRPLRRRPVHPTLTAATTHMLLRWVHNKAALVLCERWKSTTRKKPDFLTVKWTTALHARGRVCTPICLWARVSLLCVSGGKSSLEWLNEQLKLCRKDAALCSPDKCGFAFNRWDECRKTILNKTEAGLRFYWWTGRWHQRFSNSPTNGLKTPEFSSTEMI